MCKHKADMNSDETDEEDQPEEVKTPGRLPAAKDFWKPGKPRTQRRRHHNTGNNLKRRENENNETVGELLNRIERISLRRQSKMEIVHYSLPRRRKDIPRCWHEAPPLGGREKQDDVN